MKASEETDVLVLGAGPVGLFSALCLSERGIRVRIVDMYQRAALHSYALALHPQTLRILDDLGLAQSLIDRGQIIKQIAVYDGAEQRAVIDLEAVGGSAPYALVLPQSVLESALEQRLADNGVEVAWSRQLLTFDSDDKGVDSLIGRVPDPEASGDTEVEMSRVRSSFLIGADGYKSMARRLIRVEQARIGSRLTYGLMEFEAPIASPDSMTLVLGPRGADVLWPLGPERGRWGVQIVDPQMADDPEKLKAEVRSRAPWFGDAFGAVDWVAAVEFERRLARKFGLGRVWLAGDAAHYTWPLGVQSMNVGMREVHDLARRLHRILREDGSPRLLEYYNEEREREWQMLLGVKDRIRRDADTPEWAADVADTLVASLPASGQDLNRLLRQVGLKLYWLRRSKDRTEPSSSA